VYAARDDRLRREVAIKAIRQPPSSRSACLCSSASGLGFWWGCRLA